VVNSERVKREQRAQNNLQFGVFDVIIQNSEYEVHQVGPKDSGSQNFSFFSF
jgi:hypothetical protein